MTADELKEAAEVMLLAAELGEHAVVDVRNRSSSHWSQTDDPSWQWKMCCYRVRDRRDERKPLTLTLEVGKWYRTRGGDIVRVDDIDDHGVTGCSDGILRIAADGTCLDTANCDDGDFVAEATMKRVPLRPEDVFPGVAIRKTYAGILSTVITTGKDGCVFVYYLTREGIRVTYEDLMDGYEISRDGGKTWEPCWREVPE